MVHEAESRRSEGAVRSSKAHQAILEAALEILEEQGYTGFTIEAVALRARAGKPTIYRWWKSKGALLVEINDQLFSPLFQLPELGSVEAELAAYLATLWRILRVHPNAVRGAFSAAQHDADTAKLLREEMLVRRRNFVHGMLSRGVARGAGRQLRCQHSGRCVSRIQCVPVADRRSRRRARGAQFRQHPTWRASPVSGGKGFPACR